MALDHTVEYTIEQAVALLAGKISLQALSSKSKPVQRYCANMFSSKDFWESSAVNRYYQKIISGLRQGELRAVNEQVLVKIPTTDGQYKTEMIQQNKLTDEYQLSVQTRISKLELRHWVASTREAHSFLMNNYELAISRGESWDAGKLAFISAEGFAEEVTPEPVPKPNEPAANETPSDTLVLSEDLAEIQALLNGTHDFQAEELRVALQAWLETTKRFRQGDQESTPSKALKSWVSEHLDNANSYQIIRVSGIANWDHNPPPLRLVQ
ncbi:hypothetical protein [Motiliproteus sp. MSK22-1]|uniref:hypothetical protein n=1 Tax=Motiliproteus sp. MSK22-1 TaxID=1897630 RepID=UPI0009783FC3|nr:hypothetical protein [Motiliproteus sp. MSK22-1]OMH28112.1 hypothetical protein BGP75_22370 [Motiliproteus sp. MSK22-1]